MYGQHVKFTGGNNIESVSSIVKDEILNIEGDKDDFLQFRFQSWRPK